jgi:hypothetical protein
MDNSESGGAMDETGMTVTIAYDNPRIPDITMRVQDLIMACKPVGVPKSICVLAGTPVGWALLLATLTRHLVPHCGLDLIARSVIVDQLAVDEGDLSQCFDRGSPFPPELLDPERYAPPTPTDEGPE